MNLSPQLEKPPKEVERNGNIHTVLKISKGRI